MGNLKAASFSKNWWTGFKGYGKQEGRMANIYWKWPMSLKKDNYPCFLS